MKKKITLGIGTFTAAATIAATVAFAQTATPTASTASIIGKNHSNTKTRNLNNPRAGHLDEQNGAPAVFWDIPKLKPGDLILITDENNKQFTFSITRIQNYPYNDFPLQEVFGNSDEPQLNLITCNGTWDDAKDNYSHRTVVSSVLVK